MADFQQQQGASGLDPSQLSYRDMAVDATGAVMSREAKYQLRVKHGYCTSCPDIPVRLYDMKRSRLNPLWSTKTPRSALKECSGGVCLRCSPTATVTPLHKTPRTPSSASQCRSDSARTFGSRGSTHVGGGGGGGMSSDHMPPAPLLESSIHSSPSHRGSNPNAFAGDSPSSPNRRSLTLPSRNLPARSNSSPANHQYHRGNTGSRTSSFRNKRNAGDSGNSSRENHTMASVNQGSTTGTAPHGQGMIVRTNSSSTNASRPMDIVSVQRGASSRSLQRAPSVRSRRGMMVSSRANQASTRSTISALSDCPTTHNERQISGGDDEEEASYTMERDASTRSFDIGALGSADTMNESEFVELEDSFIQVSVATSVGGGTLSASAGEAQAAAFQQYHQHHASSNSGLSSTSEEQDAQADVLSLTLEDGAAAEQDARNNKAVEDLQVFVEDLISGKSFEVLAEVLTNSMKGDCSDNELLQGYCLETLAAACSNANTTNFPSFCMQAGTHKILVQTMKEYEESPEVQEHACTVVSTLANDQSCRVVLVRSGLPLRLQKTMITHMESEVVLIQCLAAIRSMSVDTEARNVFKNLSLSNQMVQVMQYHVAVREIQRDGCAILSNLAVDMERKQVSTVNYETLECILAAIQNHPADKSVVESALFALKNFTYDDTNLGTLSRVNHATDVLTNVQQQGTTAADDALIVLERVQIKQIEDLSMEESALESLRAHVQYKHQDPKLVLDVLDIMDMYTWSRQIILSCLQEMSKLVCGQRGDRKNEKNIHQLVLVNEETALSRIKGHLTAFRSDPDIARAAEAILYTCGGVDDEEDQKCPPGVPMSSEYSTSPNMIHDWE